MDTQPTRTTRRVAAFSISGEFLTSMAREHVTNGEPQRALHFLLDSLDGMTSDQAVSLLQGKTRLTGNSASGDLELSDEDPESPDVREYIERLDRQWRGIFRYNNKLYRPYAEVTVWNRDDWHFSLQVSAGQFGHVHTVGNQKDWKLIRSAFYAEDPANDLVVATADSIFLCRYLASEPPYWVPISSTPPEVFVRDYARKYGLPEVGADKGSNDLAPLVHGISMTAKRKEPSQEELEEDAEAYDARLREYAERVLEQADAGSGYLELSVPGAEGASTRLFKVPKAPFLHWAFRGVDCERFGVELPAWAPVCPQGLKMGADDPHHTDWLLGAGIDLDDAYGMDQPIPSAAYGLMHKLRTEQLRTDCTVLTGKGQAYGTVVFPQPGERVPAGSIAVIPFAGPQYQAAMESACVNGQGAVLCETGGRLAHLVVVGREFGSRIVMQPGALSRYREGDHLMVDCDEHRIEVNAL